MFTKVNGKVVSIDLTRSGPVIARRGAMLFYTGNVFFQPHQIPGMGGGMGGALGGLAGMAGRMMQGEHEATMVAQGHGTVHYGFRGLEVEVVEMPQGVELRVDFDWQDNRTGKTLVARRSFSALDTFVPAQGTGERIEKGQHGVIQQLARDLVAELRTTW